ncbi:hypothetical protein EGW08_010683 [Elysia chlorotica]|uniref:Uncharacterized protein n=1 Tax=Elysia chlorotica TaxID=188477 RepID=A0A3S1HKU0_ELYCH|nr:hypothetical protein EGW08_010683 [Elysia chlorotica]
MLADIIRLAKKTHDYLKTTPPKYDSAEASKIKVLLYVSSIDAINEARMDFTVGILLHLRWVDNRIYHDKAHMFFESAGVDMLDFDSENINKARDLNIFFPNEKKGSFHDIMIKNQMMRLYRGGALLYISRLSVTLSCPMNLINYPFDKQTCHLILMSFGYADVDVQFEWMNRTEPIMDDLDLDTKSIILDKEVTLPQFEVTSVEANTCRFKYHQKVGNHSCLQADFHMSRNIGFYIVQMYIPSTLIVMLSWISFWLTVNSVPGRISLGLLTVLTMTTQMSSVNASLPRVSYTKAIDVWMSACLVFVFSALLEFAIVNVLSRKDSIGGFSIKHIFTIPRELLPGAPSLAEVGNHSCLQADFHMSRNIGFYIVQMYIPSTLIVMLSWISFWLTVNSVPGRISLGLLTVLTMTTQMSSVNASLPRVSYTKAIDVWMSACLVFVFSALLEFAIVNVLSRKDSIGGFSIKHIFTIPRELLPGAPSLAEAGVTVPLDGYADADGKVKKRRFNQKGIVYAMYMDIAARILFPVSFIIFTITYWLYYSNAEN